MDSVEEVLADRVELIQRAVEAAEKSQRFAGLDFYDEKGNFVRHINLKQDPEPARQALNVAKEQLDTYRKSLV